MVAQLCIGYALQSCVPWLCDLCLPCMEVIISLYDDDESINQSALHAESDLSNLCSRGHKFMVSSEADEILTSKFPPFCVVCIILCAL